MTFAIRHLRLPEEAALVVALQATIWGGADVPAHVMLTAAHNGGLLAGIFAEDALVGFVWGFLGFDERTSPPRLKHCSHQLGIHPHFRNRGFGFLLKRFQWEFVQRQGIELITWTYDPLLANNAHLNIARLGAVCNTYRRDEYGDLDDDLNTGLPTDRFQVDLWVNSTRVHSTMNGSPCTVASVNDVQWVNPPGEDGRVLPPYATSAAAIVAGADPGAIAVAIPSDFQRERRVDAERARAWRYATRDVFETLFGCGYSVVTCGRGATYSYYLLNRSAAPPS